MLHVLDMSVHHGSHLNCVDMYTTHVILSCSCTFHFMHITLRGSRRATQRVCGAHSFHLHVHPWWAFDRPWSESQNVLLSSLNVQQTRTGRFVLGASSSDCSEWNIVGKWSSQEWKSGELLGARTERPVYDKFVIHDDMDSDTVTGWMIDCERYWVILQKMQSKISTNGMIWWLFMSSTSEASVFMGKNFSDNLHSTKNTGEDLIWKQMFDISEKLIVEQSDETCGVSQISWESSPWKQFYLVNDEEVLSLSHAKVFVFSDSVLCLGKVNQNPTSNIVWEELLEWFKDSPQHSRILHTIDCEPMELSNIYPGFTIVQLVDVVEKFMNRMRNPAEFQGRIIFMSMFNDIIWWKTMNRNVLIMPRLCLYLQKDFQQDVGHSADLDQKRSGILFTTKDHEETGTESLKWWWSSSEKADTQFSEPRVHCLEERRKAKEVENYRNISVLLEMRLKLFFAQWFLLISSVSTEQSQMCVRKTGIATQERWDPCWQENLTHCSSQQNYWQWHPNFDCNSCTRKAIAEAHGTSGKASTSRSSD